MKIRDVFKVDIACLNALSNEVIVHFNMFRACVEHWVPSQMNTAHVVEVKGNPIFDGNAQILQYPLEPYGFTGSHDHAPVFGLCARKCNSRLFFATPRDDSTFEGENKFGGRLSIGLIAGLVGNCAPFELNWRGRLKENVVDCCSNHES